MLWAFYLTAFLTYTFTATQFERTLMRAGGTGGGVEGRAGLLRHRLRHLAPPQVEGAHVGRRPLRRRDPRRRDVPGIQPDRGLRGAVRRARAVNLLGTSAKAAPATFVSALARPGQRFARSSRLSLRAGGPSDVVPVPARRDPFPAPPTRVQRACRRDDCPRGRGERRRERCRLQRAAEAASVSPNRIASSPSGRGGSCRR